MKQKGVDLITGDLHNVNFVNKLFTLSNQGIQVMKLPENRC